METGGNETEIPLLWRGGSRRLTGWCEGAIDYPALSGTSSEKGNEVCFFTFNNFYYQLHIICHQKVDLQRSHHHQIKLLHLKKERGGFGKRLNQLRSFKMT